MYNFELLRRFKKHRVHNEDLYRQHQLIHSHSAHFGCELKILVFNHLSDEYMPLLLQLF